MTPPAHHFEAAGGGSLLDALRRALAGDGRPPSKRSVLAWIAAGRVRVDQQIVTDPQHVLVGGERVDLGEDPGEAWQPAAAPRPRAGRPSRPPGRGTETGTGRGLLHLDRHLIVVDYALGPAPVGEGDVLAYLQGSLEAAGIEGMAVHAIQPAHGRASGLVLGAISEATAPLLEAAFRDGEARLVVAALVRLGPASRLEGLEIEDAAPGHVVALGSTGSVETFLRDLEGRGLVLARTPGRPPRAGRPVLLHVTRLELSHPRTGRRLLFESPFSTGTPVEERTPRRPRR